MVKFSDFLSWSFNTLSCFFSMILEKLSFSGNALHIFCTCQLSFIKKKNPKTVFGRQDKFHSASLEQKCNQRSVHTWLQYCTPHTRPILTSFDGAVCVHIEEFLPKCGSILYAIPCVTFVHSCSYFTAFFCLFFVIFLWYHHSSGEKLCFLDAWHFQPRNAMHPRTAFLAAQSSTKCAFFTMLLLQALTPQR